MINVHLLMILWPTILLLTATHWSFIVWLLFRNVYSVAVLGGWQRAVSCETHQFVRSFRHIRHNTRNQTGINQKESDCDAFLLFQLHNLYVLAESVSSRLSVTALSITVLHLSDT
jgi:hypothetical protein